MGQGIINLEDSYQNNSTTGGRDSVKKVLLKDIIFHDSFQDGHISGSGMNMTIQSAAKRLQPDESYPI